MIASFKSRALRRFAEQGDASKLSVQNIPRITRILRALDVAKRPEQMDLPGFGFHSLKGDRKGDYSVWVSGNWRITFGFEGENVVRVNLEDYH